MHTCSGQEDLPLPTLALVLLVTVLFRAEDSVGFGSTRSSETRLRSFMDLLMWSQI